MVLVPLNFKLVAPQPDHPIGGGGERVGRQSDALCAEAVGVTGIIDGAGHAVIAGSSHSTAGEQSHDAVAPNVAL
ncbi:MAG: hypothetical protein IPG69_12480 [Flavobacteriales bacterium]|nr:hypothetical protein [Flavobacteriales bacterium]